MDTTIPDPRKILRKNYIQRKNQVQQKLFFIEKDNKPILFQSARASWMKTFSRKDKKPMVEEEFFFSVEIV